MDLLITFAYSACMAGSLHFVVPINVSAEDSSQVDGSGKRKIVTFKLEGTQVAIKHMYVSRGEVEDVLCSRNV